VTIAPEPTYGLPNSWADARRRLALIGDCLDGTARRRLGAVGSLTGWSCLEVGGGGGSVAALLAELVGPTGTVTATDIDTRFLDERRSDVVSVWRHDITTDPLPRDTFDLVHTRSLLMHLPARDRVIATLVAALRPGGWILLEESDFYPVDVTAAEPYRSAWKAVNEALAGAGMDPGWARGLPPLLQDMGLVDVEADAEVAMFPGGSPMAELMQLTFQHARDAVAAELRPSVDASLAALADDRRWFPGPAVVGVRARRPDPLQNP
jgi:SAM-dependent methyltransferase